MASRYNVPTIQGSDPIQTFQLQQALMRQRQPSDRAAMARALMQQGASTAPVQHWLQGLARATQGIVGGYMSGEEEREGKARDEEMLAGMIGQRDQTRQAETAQLAQAGVPGFQMPMPQPVPGEAQQVPIAPAGGGDVVMPANMPTPPPQPPTQPVDARMISALMSMGAAGNQTAAGAAPALAFQYQDQMAREREARQEAMERQRLAVSSRETFGQPVVEMVDGQPALVRYGNLGGRQVVPGATPQPETPKPPTPTEMERTLVAAGIQPGTPEFQALMRQAAERKIAPPAPAAVVNMGDGGLGRELARGTAAEVGKAREGALAAERSIESANRIVEALDSGAITGVGAEFRLNAARVLSSIGLIDGKQVANTQALLGELAKNVLAESAQMAGVLTDKDIEFLRDAAQGRIAYTAETLRRAAELAARGHVRIIDRYNTLVEPMQQDENLPAMTRRLYSPMTPPAFRGAAPPPAGAAPGALPAPSGGSRVIEYDASGRRITR
jgi:hypothetical protein